MFGFACVCVCKYFDNTFRGSSGILIFPQKWNTFSRKPGVVPSVIFSVMYLRKHNPLFWILELADFLFPLLIRNCRVGKLVSALYLSLPPGLAVREVRTWWESHCEDELPCQGWDLLALSLLFCSLCLSSGLTFNSSHSTRPTTARITWDQVPGFVTQLFVVIFTALCQQELNMAKP